MMRTEGFVPIRGAGPRQKKDYWKRAFTLRKGEGTRKGDPPSHAKRNIIRSIGIRFLGFLNLPLRNIR
jgi:hypothetical protein